MARITDVWHSSRSGAPPCAEHGKPPSKSHNKGRRWQVRYRDLNGLQRKESYDRKAPADARAAEVENTLRRGTYIDPHDAKITFREFAEQWRQSQPGRPGTKASIESVLRLRCYPVLGDRQLGAIRPSEVQQWLSGLDVSPGTARLAFSKAKQIFNAAVADGILVKSPALGVKPPPAPHREIVPMTVPEIEALANKVPDRFQAVIIAGAGLGLRPGELLGLRVKDVNFLGRSVRVVQQIQRVKGKGMVACPPKTRSSIRTVPLPTVVANALSEHLRKYPAGPDDYIFRMENGLPVVPSWFSNRLLPAGVGLHDFRHAYASLLINAGESVKVVAERLGHTSAKMTLDVYSHLFPDSAEHTRKAVDDAFAAALPSSALDVPSDLPGRQ